MSAGVELHLRYYILPELCDTDVRFPLSSVRRVHVNRTKSWGEFKINGCYTCHLCEPTSGALWKKDDYYRYMHSNVGFSDTVIVQ